MRLNPDFSWQPGCHVRSTSKLFVSTIDNIILAELVSAQAAFPLLHTTRLYVHFIM